MAIRPGAKHSIEKPAGTEQTNVPFVQWRQRTSTENYLAGMAHPLGLECRRGLGQRVLDLIEGKAAEFKLRGRTRRNRVNAIRHFAERRNHFVLPSQVVQLAI